ncbi:MULTISPECIES: PGF-pre-PGF domain-containing protein [unclassified Methanoregula]|uniref:PGF-pre-PGF domain-containing protein n=1 Tax=unclassified Methanoregula TaxID=2649730 RepID=UPI0025E9E580|nr:MULTISPECIES: PGF-pre-PGF domain-containing protein [unclassified Methanoregula]
MSGTMILISCGCMMVAVRKSLVFAVLLIAVLALAAPVSAYSHSVPGSFNLTEALAPGPAPSPSPHVMDASTRAMFDAMAVNDTSAFAPSSMVMESVHPGESLQAAIDAAPAGSVLYLDPGIYYEHDLIINKQLIIMANATLGGTRANTIIDARMEGRIFNVTGAGMFYFDNLTLRNGYVSDDGGAIFAKNALTGIISSTITNCSAAGNGGAIWSGGMTTVIGWSTVSRCTAVNGSGGAVYSDDNIFGAVYTTFTDCSAPDDWGGAIEAGGQLIVWYSTFTRCSAIDGGALDFYDEGAQILASTFTDCTASGYGGAVWADGGPVYIVGSSFTRCSADSIGGAIALGEELVIDSTSFTGCSAGMAGGAIATGGDIITTGSTFQGCSADLFGGALYIGSLTGDIINSTFSGCTTSGNGGAIASLGSDLTMLSSSITGCSAAQGGAIWNYYTTADIHFCRIYGNTASIAGPAIYTSGAIDATHTWWGTNSDPGAMMNGPVAYDPWLVLGITATPQAITLPQTAYIRTNLTYDSNGVDTIPGDIFVPNGIPNAYAVISGTGIVAPATAGTAGGAAQGTYITTVAGAPTISGTVDGQTVYITLNVAQGDWTPAPIQVPNDDDWPQVSSGVSGGGGGGGTAATGSTGYPVMTVTVNIGGDSKAGQATVTGTNLRDLIVTGTVQHGQSGSCTPPVGTVFQYLGLEPARYGTITNAVIHFTVPQAWLDENHIDPKSIVLHHMTPDCWQPLPTTLLTTKDGTVYYSAQSSGFSSFAIAGTTAVVTPEVTATQDIVSTPFTEQVTTPPVTTQEPVTTQTTAPAAPAQVPAKSSPFPLVPVIAVICCAGIIGGGWYARRWWIRRQNPALFEEC